MYPNKVIIDIYLFTERLIIDIDKYISFLTSVVSYINLNGYDVKTLVRTDELNH